MSLNQQKIIERVRSNLIPYCALQFHGFKAPPHIKHIAKCLEAVERGEISRLIITVPPRHGKSMLVSQFFPAWYLGRNPDEYIITATYGQDLANDFGRKVRDQLRDPLFTKIFPKCNMRSDSHAQARFATEEGGEYYGVGVGGPVTGRGAHLLLIDDPIKNREEADSRLIRSKIKDWYTSTAYTRLMPGGAVAIIMTRWNVDDLVGFVLKEHSHENWTVINLPAMVNGQPLWEEQYSLESLERIKNTMSTYDWACLYQQDPIQQEGAIFKPDYIKNGYLDDYAAIYIACDPAISKSDTADETSFCVVGIGYGSSPSFYEIETVHGRWDSGELLSIGRELYRKHSPDIFGLECVQGQSYLVDDFNRLGVPCLKLKADGDKVRRAHSITHFFSQGRVHLNTTELIDQCMRFRGLDGDDDDMVDSLVYALRIIKEYSKDSYIAEGNRYEGLDSASEQFWRSFRKELSGEKDDKEKHINQLLGS